MLECCVNADGCGGGDDLSAVGMEGGRDAVGVVVGKTRVSERREERSTRRNIVTAVAT